MSEVSYKEKLKENVLNSSWKEELKASPEVRTAIFDYIDHLSEDQASALLDLDGFKPIVTIETKDVPQIINAKDPERIQRAPSEDLGTITYEQPPIMIADLLVMIAASRNGRDFLQSAVTSQEDPYWKQIAEILPSEKAFRPKNYPLITTKFSQKYRSLPQKETRGFSFEAPQEVTKGKKKFLITTSATARYTGEGKIVPQPIDMSISSAVASLLLAGNTVITPAMIWRWMAEARESAKVTKHQEKLITEEVEKMMQTLMAIDATEEARFYNPNIIKNANIKQNVLMLRGADITTVNGKKAIGWKPVYDEMGNVILPILYVHAQISGQIQSVDPEDLRIEGISMTEQNIVLRDVILTNIHRLNPKKGVTSIKITYAQLYKYAKIDEGSKTARVKKQRVRETVKKILQHLKNRGHFSDFKEYGRSKIAKDGVEILSPPALEEL